MRPLLSKKAGIEEMTKMEAAFNAITLRQMDPVPHPMAETDSIPAVDGEQR
jgi:hypothetical protein